jgi:integrase
LAVLGWASPAGLCRREELIQHFPRVRARSLPAQRTKEAEQIAKELVTLRAALKLAKRAGVWRGELEAIFPPDFSPKYKPKKRALSREELYRLLGELTPDRAARVAFIVATSASWGETKRARREHVSEDRRTVFVDGTKRALRRRTVPIVFVEQRSLLEYAIKHAQGADGALFTP